MSSLARWLVQEAAWRTLSPQVVQKIAALAVADMEMAYGTTPNLNDLVTLSKLGTTGSYSNNVHRDLFGCKLTQSDLPTNIVSIPMKLQITKPPVNCVQTLLLPHRLFAHWYNHHPGVFQKRICPSPQALESFWIATEAAGHPALVGHDMCARANWRQRAVPIKLHGDGVPITGAGKAWSKSVDVYSWNSIMGTGTTLELEFLVWLVHASQCSKTGVLTTDTKLKFYHHFCASLTKLYNGVDDNGDVLCPGHGYFGVPWVISGDLDWFYKEYGLANCNSNEPCFYCQCNSTTVPWRNLVPDAEWTRCIHTDASFQAHNNPLHPLLSLPFVTVFQLWADWMHSKHLGSDKYYAGSVFWVLVYEILGDTASNNLARVWDEIVLVYKSRKTKSRYGNMHLGMFCDPKHPTDAKFPELKGKAAEVAHLMPCLLQVFQQFKTPGNVVHDMIELGLMSSCTADAKLEEHAGVNVLPAQAANEVKHLVFSFMLAQNYLCTHYGNIGLKLFNIVPKSHYMSHLGIMAKYFNPRQAWAYMGEDFMQKVKKLAGGCSRGIKAHKLEPKVMKHYCTGLYFLLVDPSCWWKQ